MSTDYKTFPFLDVEHVLIKDRNQIFKDKEFYKEDCENEKCSLS